METVEHLSAALLMTELTEGYDVFFMSFIDSKGQPRSITNSKGKTRRPMSKDLSESLKTSDLLFIDFIKKCLE